MTPKRRFTAKFFEPTGDGSIPPIMECTRCHEFRTCPWVVSTLQRGMKRICETFVKEFQECLVQYYEGWLPDQEACDEAHEDFSDINDADWWKNTE